MGKAVTENRPVGTTPDMQHLAAVCIVVYDLSDNHFDEYGFYQ